MTKIKRRDVLKGAAYAMSVPFGGRTYADATDAWGGANTGGGGGTSSPGVSMTLSTRRGQQQVAPEGIAFFASVEGFDSQPPDPGKVYDPTMHDITYIWDFGDEGQFTSLDRVPTEWKDRNVGYGPFPAHVFPTGKTYAVLCGAYERSSGKQAFASIEVTVQDPEAVFTSATTICVDPDGDFTGAPTSVAANRVTTWAAAMARADSFAGGSALVRLLFRSGKTTDVTSVGWWGSTKKNAYVSSWGGAAKAKLRMVTEAAFGPFVVQGNLRVQGASFSNIELDGQWDAALPGMKAGAVWSGTSGRPNAGIYVHGGFSTFYNMTIRNTSGNAFNRGQATGITAIACDVVTDGWQNMGWFMDGEPTSGTELTIYFALIGCRATQTEQATMGGNYRAANAGQIDNEHGCLRLQACAYAYVDAFEGFSRNGWTVTGDVPFEQNIIRDCRNDRKSKGFFSRIMGEGGASIYSAADASSGAALPCNAVLDKFMFLGGSRSLSGLSLLCSAITVRNGVTNRPNTIQGPNGYSYGIQLGDPGKISLIQPTAGNEPIFVYNVTNVNEQNSANMPTEWTPIYTVPGCYNEGMIQLSNNIQYRPNNNTPNTPDAPLSNARLGLASRHKGWRWRSNTAWVTAPQITDKMTMDPAYAIPTNSWSFFRPTTGSPAIGSATTGKVAYDDLLGNVRPAQATRGAVEPV